MTETQFRSTAGGRPDPGRIGGGVPRADAGSMPGREHTPPRRGLALVLAGLLAASTIGAARAGADAAAPPPFRRGVSVHEPLNWGNLKPADPAHYTDTPFAGPHHALPDTVLRNAAAAGFDFVRLTVDPGPFLQLTGAPRAALDETLMAEVAGLRRFGFAVLVDIHPVEQVPGYGRALMVPGARPGFDEYRALVARVARLLGGLNTRSVGLELMNEPDGYDPDREARWQRQLEGLHAAARGAAPDLPLVLSGAEGGDAGGLEHLDARPFRGSDVFYTFHYYEPHDFTHQGVSDDGGKGAFRRYLAGLPYPSGVPFDAATLVGDDLSADRRLDGPTRRRLSAEAIARARAYAAGGYDRDRVRRDFDRVTAWASARDVPASRILLGEFSVSRRSADHVGADPLSAEAWLRDVRQEAERHGFVWSYWVLSDAVAMQLVTHDGGSALDPGVLAALGLHDPEADR